MATIKTVGYATYPSVKLQKIVTDPETGQKSLSYVKELLFGDYMKAYVENGEYVKALFGEGKKQTEYIKVHCRNADGYIKRSEIQFDRPLEVNFIDVGQGDGCHIVTPDDKHFLIDAGESDNMYRFLKWRFNLNSPKNVTPPFTVVISHSDKDHYQGFGKIFAQSQGKDPQIKIEKVYHNGMVETGSGLKLLGRYVDNGIGNRHITDLCDTDDDFKARSKTVTNGKYINVLKKTDAEKVAVRKGSDPIYRNDQFDMRMEIMGPVAETVEGKDALPVFGGSDAGMTKNGHSVIVKLTIGHLRLLVGGDLNAESERYLIRKYTGVDVATAEKADVEKAISLARESLQVDIAKCCHHGSADYSTEFLDVLNPIATIISSGDEEKHCHPRPDTLGTIGKYSRGVRSLIFSTELARSGKEFLELKDLKLSAQKKKERVVTVYGMINVRTDGNKAIIAQKLEKPATGRGWDIHKLEWNEKKKDFEYVKSKDE